MSIQKTSVPDADRGGRIAQFVLSFVIFAGFAGLLFFPDAAAADTGLFRQIFDAFAAPSEFGVLNAAYYTLAGFYVLLIGLTVIGVFVRKKAAFVLNFVKTFAGIAACAFLVYALIGGAGVDPDAVFHTENARFSCNATLLIPAFGIVMSIVLTLFYYKARGILPAISALLAFSFAAFLFYDSPVIGGARLIDLFDLRYSYGQDAWGRVVSVCFIALAYATAVNALLALLSLALRRTGPLELIRASAVFALAVVGFGLLIGETGLTALPDYAANLGILAISFIQLVFAVTVFAVRAKRKKAARAADAEDDYAAAARVNAALDEAANISAEELAATQRPFYGGAIRDETTAYGEPLEEAVAFDFDQKKHDGSFNRDYSDFRAEEETLRRAADRPYGAPAESGFRYADPARPFAAEGTAAPYPPDAFINGLTPAERDEFDRLFITRVYGENRRLPAYTVGADNREFFAKVFVFMGRFRNIISESLLEKIYNYSNAIR